MSRRLDRFLLFGGLLTTFIHELLQTRGISAANFVTLHVVDTPVLRHEEHAGFSFDLYQPHHFSIQHVDALRLFARLLLIILCGFFL